MRKTTKLLAGTAAVLLASTAIGVADTSTVPVTVGVVNGQRALAVTGVDNGVATGPASLSFRDTATRAPFGVIVSDTAYERIGYRVYGTLSNLYQEGDCSSPIPSNAFSIDFTNATAPSISDVSATVEPLTTYVDDDITEDVNAILGAGTLTSTLSTTVENVPGLITDLTSAVESLGLSPSLVTGLSFMGVSNGSGDLIFDDPVAHPDCADDNSSNDEVDFQFGSTQSPDLTPLASDMVAAAENVTDDDRLDAVLEAIPAGFLPTGSDSKGGVLWERTRSALQDTLSGVLLLTSTQLDDITDLVVDDLYADVADSTADMVLNLLGQTGIYTNLPEMVYDTSALSTPPDTGVYSGVMTVTLVDQ